MLGYEALPEDVEPLGGNNAGAAASGAGATGGAVTNAGASGGGAAGGGTASASAEGAGGGAAGLTSTAGEAGSWPLFPSGGDGDDEAEISLDDLAVGKPGGLSAGQVACGDQACDTTGAGTCCVTSYPGFPSAPALDAFVCEPQPAGECAFELSCDSANDCPSGQVCCMHALASPPKAYCADSCVTLGTATLECALPSDCPSGRHCCGEFDASWWSFESLRYDAVRCTLSCNGDSSIRFCGADTDCPSGQSCRASSIIPGRAICRS